jgi:tetratricopeptide (TPR) repeat protein
MTTPERLHAVYDLAVSPASFDILSFLVEANRHARQCSIARIQVLIVPLAADAHRLFDLHDSTQDAWRISNILIPSCGLLPAVHGLTVASSRDQAQSILSDVPTSHIFPDDYTVAVPRAHHHTAWPVIAAHMGANLQHMRATSEARRYARQWLDARAGGRKAVILTLREAQYTPRRNSNIDEWLKFAELLERAGYFPVIVRDTDRALDLPDERFGRFTLCAEAAFNLDLRLALYEECHIAAFVSNGPSTPCYFDRDVRYLYFVTGEWRDETPPGFYRVGIGENTTPPFANAYQRWVWCDQDADRFTAEIMALDGFIVARHADGTYESGLDPVEAYREPLNAVAERMGVWARRYGSPADWEIICYCFERAYERSHDGIGHQFSPTYYLARGRKYEALDRWADAHALYEEGVTAFNREDPELMGALAQSHIRQGRRDLGIACFRENIHRHGTLQHHLNLAVAFEALGLWPEALAAYDEASANFGMNPVLQFRRHVVLGMTGYEAEAIAYFKGLVDSGSTSRVIHVELAAIYERSGRLDEAVKILDAALAKGIRTRDIVENRKGLLTKLVAG